MKHQGVQTFVQELRNTAEGGDHSNSVLEYLAVLAWGSRLVDRTSIRPLRSIETLENRGRLRLTLLWIASIAIPLLLNGNRQKHLSAADAASGDGSGGVVDRCELETA